MRAFVTALAFAVALIAAVFVIAVQRNPFAFTGRQISKEPLDPPPRVQPVAMAVVIDEPEPSVNPVITLDEIDIVARPTPRAQAAPAPEPNAPKLIAPPCVDGEYRSIDEQRGVYLICPGSEKSVPQTK